MNKLLGALSSNLIISILVFATPAYAGDQIRIVGSATVYPFCASAAEHFGKIGDFRTPVVEATGSGAGFKLFCTSTTGMGPDITNASRSILDSEIKQCYKNDIHDIVEVKIGFDGITLANSVKAPLFKLTREQIFLALAREVPQGNKLVPNPYTHWDQIAPSLPKQRIKVYGTPPVSGTRDTFVELVMQKGCAATPEFTSAYPDEHIRKGKCQQIREDGVFIEAGENGNLITQKLISDPESIGILGFSFLDQNTGRIQGSVIDGFTPDYESIQTNRYPVSRMLYFYINADHLHKTPGILEFTQEFLSEAAIGDEGYLVRQGLIPLPVAEREAVRKKVINELKLLTEKSRN